jgi:hypothetical protein
MYLQLLDGVTAQCSIGFRSDGAILLISGGPTGTTLATYTGAITAINTWYAFEFEVFISGTAGYMNVRKNGNTSNDFSSATNLATRVSANNYANKLLLGLNNSVAVHQIDDLFWRSDATSVSWLGDVRCYVRMPANDVSVQFSRTPLGVLTQTVPTVAGTINGITANRTQFTAFTAAYGGVVSSASVSVNTGNAGSAKCAIYADNGSGLQPSTILATATASVTPVPTGTMTFTFSPGLTVTKGTLYWIAVNTDTGGGFFSIPGGNFLTGAFAAAAYSTFPTANPVVTTNSNLVQMSWTFASTPANWQAVAEPQQDDVASYVYDNTPGHADAYGIATITAVPSTVYAVTTRGYVQKNDVGSRTMAVQLKSGGTTVATPTVVPQVGLWTWAWRTDVTDPNTGVAWTPAAVNAVNVGPTILT